MFPSLNQIASHGFGGQQQHVQQIFQNSPIQRPETSIDSMQGMGAMGRSGTQSFGMGTQHMRFGTLRVGQNTGAFSSSIQVPTSPSYGNIARPAPQGIHMPTPQSMQPVHQQGQIFQNQARIPDQIPQFTNQQHFGNQQQFANQNI
jgi:hypothetical protein